MKRQKLGYAFNEAPQGKTEQLFVTVDKNSLVDEGNGTVRFKNGLVITDNSEQRNGTKYDIGSMDLAEYKGVLTADHRSSIESIIGKVVGTRKVASRKVVIDAIQFAIKENALARFAKDMLTGGFATDFSIETFGPYPDDEGVYHNSKLIGLSLVVTGNNRSATLNEVNKLALNTIAESKELGLDTSLIEKEVLHSDSESSIKDTNSNNEGEDPMKYATVTNSKKFAVDVTFKDDEGKEVTVNVLPGKSIQVLSEEKEAVEKQVNDAVEPAKPAEGEEGEAKESLADMVKAAVAPLVKQVNELKSQAEEAFNSNVDEPSFKRSGSNAPAIHNSVSKDLEAMDHTELHEIQINSAIAMLTKHDAGAARKLNTVNSYFLEKLQEAKKVSNSLTLADFGNFVISPELLTEIEGHRSNFRPLIEKLSIKDTLSLQMAWLERSGDINMQEVEFCDDGANGNLKPISEYGAEIRTSNLMEVAAVTPVCNAATRFAAVDLLGDVAAGYRTDFDRKRAQLFVARLQQAVDYSGNKLPYSKTTALAALTSFIGLASAMQEDIMGGTFILSQKSYFELISMELAAGINTDSGFKIFSTGSNGTLLLGSPYVIVPNELLPALNTNETRAFVVEGVTVTINQAVFYADLSTYAGRTSGGLMYDLSTEAAYEVESVVKSAYQRNELVLRGSFFRGGAVKDRDRVTSMYAAGIS